MFAPVFLMCLLPSAADPPIRADLPYTAGFQPVEARFVRVVIFQTSGGDPCIDELEIYGPHDKQNLALASHGAKASASSCIPAIPSTRLLI